jgi:hypothetical protein
MFDGITTIPSQEVPGYPTEGQDKHPCCAFSIESRLIAYLKSPQKKNELYPIPTERTPFLINSGQIAHTSNRERIALARWFSEAVGMIPLWGSIERLILTVCRRFFREYPSLVYTTEFMLTAQVKCYAEPSYRSLSRDGADAAYRFSIC